jgi:predicted ATPase/DNA-binding winged helix-turn-helix (wHTH) protein
MRKIVNRSTAVTEGTSSGLTVPSDVPRATSSPGDFASFGPFRLFPTARVIESNGVPLALGNRALDILIVLVERAGEVVSHRELISRAWRGLVVDPGNLRVHISGLRKALGDTEGAPGYIANVPGQGYCFVAPVMRASSPDPAQLSPATVCDPAAQRRRALPPMLARMIGRDDMVRTIAADLRAERFVTIVAPGGMGKTTVAVSVAHAMMEEFSGMVCFVDVGAIKDPWLVPATIASALGLAIQTEDALPPLMAFLLSARMLLVLDNCEHLIDVTAPLAERIFFDAPSVHILATSRETLRVEGEHACWLPPLESPEPGSNLKAGDILTFPAVKLLVERAAASDSRFELNDANAPLVADICARLDGVALALELVGGRVGTYGVEATLNLLTRRLGLHWQGRRTALPRHQTLHALLDWSYGLLAESERLVFQRLSIFVGTFTLEGAQAVAAGGDLSETHVASTVDHLVAKSLVSAASAEDGVIRYRLLEMTRAFAFNKLLESGEEAAVARRHARYLVLLLDSSFGGRLEPSLDHRTAARREHLGNVRAALEWCFGKGLPGTAAPNNAALAVELAAASAPAFLEFSLLIECDKWSAAALALVDDATRGGKRELVLQEARAISSTWTRGNGEDVRTAIIRGLEIAQNLGETSHRLRLLTGMHVYLIRTGDFRGSLAAAEELYAVARTTDVVWWLTLSDWLRGASEHFLGDQAAAKRHFEKGFARGGAHNAQQFGVDYRIRALVPFARVLWLSGYPDRAAQLARDAIDEGVLSGRPVNVCFSLLYTSPVFLWLGDFGTARDVIEKLLTHANWQALVSIHAEGLALKGALLICLGEIGDGITLLRSALTSLRAGRQHILTTLGAAWLADGLATIGRFDEALEVIGDALANVQGGTEALEAPELLRVKAAILLSTPEPNESAAESCLMRSLACARRQSALAWELRTAMTLVRLRAGQGRVAEARELLSPLYGRFTEGFETSDLKAARKLLNELDVSA